MRKALQRDAEGTARVVPILLRPVDWEDAPFSNLQILPTGAKPVTRWADRDDAFEDIAKELRKVVKELQVVLSKKAIERLNKKLEDTVKEWLSNVVELRSIGLEDISEADTPATLKTLRVYEQTIEACNSLLELRPDYAVLYYQKGLLLYDLKKYEEMIDAYDQVIRLDPKNAHAYYNKGIALQRLNRRNEAQAAFTRAQELGYTG